MGLPTVIDSISHEQQWAHSMTRQPYLSIHMSYNWPIHCHRQYFLWQQWAHSILLATFPLRSNGPFQCPRPVLSRAGMGPSTVISSISHEQQWAQSMSSATLPVHTHELQLAHSLSSAVFLMAIMGPFNVIGSSSHVQ